jgi:hypothetical protein
MTLPPIWSPSQGSGFWWHRQEKWGLITTHPSHFHEFFVDNVVTSSHQARIVALNYFLEAQEKNIKINKTKSKRK